MSTTMTPTQRNYAVSRISAIAGKMKSAISKKFVVEEAKSITVGELVKLILNGTIKPQQKNAHKLLGGGYQPHCINTLSEAFEILDPSPYYRTSPVRDEVKMSAAITEVETKATQLRDGLMLSDAAKALAQVVAFEEEAAALTKKSR